MKKRWRLRPHDPDCIARLQQGTGLTAVVAQLLACRGISDPAVAREFIDAKLTALRDPNDLPGATQAAERLAKAIEAGERITVYGDYDVDGMSATALMWQCLKLAGANAGYYVPNRIDEGYGLNDTALESLAEQGTRLVVTVDCGISAVNEARRAAELGLDLIITDHHQPGSELPRATAIVHPQIPAGAYPFTGLSGSGVAFKVASALCQRVSQAKKVSPAMKDFLLQAVALTALGTVADVVPLIDENRILVRHGLESLRERPTLGLRHAHAADRTRPKAEVVCRRYRVHDCSSIECRRTLGASTVGSRVVNDHLCRARHCPGRISQRIERKPSGLERSIYLAANKQRKSFSILRAMRR